MAAIDLLAVHPPSGDGGYRKNAGHQLLKAAKSSVDTSSVTTAATRWMAAIDLLAVHPPSGDGGYEELKTF
jgi:hypothetical protein